MLHKENINYNVKSACVNLHNVALFKTNFAEIKKALAAAKEALK